MNGIAEEHGRMWEERGVSRGFWSQGTCGLSKSESFHVFLGHGYGIMCVRWLYQAVLDVRRPDYSGGN